MCSLISTLKSKFLGLGTETLLVSTTQTKRPARFSHVVINSCNIYVSVSGVYSNSSTVHNRGASEFLPPSADTCPRYQGLEGNFDANSPGSMREGWVWIKKSIIQSLLHKPHCQCAIFLLFGNNRTEICRLNYKKWFRYSCKTIKYKIICNNIWIFLMVYVLYCSFWLLFISRQAEYLTLVITLNDVPRGKQAILNGQFIHVK